MGQGGDTDESVRPTASVMQHAIRLLVLLDGCGESVVKGDPEGSIAVVRAELRPQALDCWLRNPDYLAGELLTMVEAGALDAVAYLPVVEGLLNNPEPDLHWYPMPRWHHGAYETIDDAFRPVSVRKNWLRAGWRYPATARSPRQCADLGQRTLGFASGVPQLRMQKGRLTETTRRPCLGQTAAGQRCRTIQDRAGSCRHQASG